MYAEDERPDYRLLYLPTLPEVGAYKVPITSVCTYTIGKPFMY